MENKEKFIVCPKCNTKYKKPGNIPLAGINVKCKKCGTSFYIPPSPNLENQDDFFTDSLVRKPDATIIRIKDLKELSEKIINEEIFASDEISKDGKIWKTVGELKETKIAFEKRITPTTNIDAFFKHFYLRSPQKEIIKMKTLAQLQKKIVAMEINENFEVSKNQNYWYKLSGIEELTLFLKLLNQKN